MLRTMTERTRGYAHRVDVTAAVSAVWNALIDARALGLWCAPGAEISARAGGAFRANVDRVTETEAHIDVFEPQRRIRLIHLPLCGIPSFEATLVDDFMLDEAPAGATLRLLGSGFPSEELWDELFLRRRAGWQRALARLKVLVEREARAERTTARP
jgi:uncharacterized protein YndB with AHSA1/START domain